MRCGVPREDVRFLLFLIPATLLFLARFAQLTAGGDDIGWLNGEIPTVFDRYRYVPRLIFRVIRAVAGPHALAALAVIASFHLLNVFLVLHWGYRLTSNRVAAQAAAVVFAINPLTLGTLTWISCLSYVVGCSLMLFTLLATRNVFHPGRRRQLVWAVITLLLYALTLLSCHDAFFLPVLFPLLARLEDRVPRGAAWGMLLAGGMVAFAVNGVIYRLTDHGIQPAKLFSLPFLTAYVSMVFSSAAGLSLSYGLSFFQHPVEMLQWCFSPLGRGLLMCVIGGIGAFFARPGKSWRLHGALALAFAALITPFILRLYLMPDAASYHISYVLSGRVFYLPFTVLAVWMGIFVSHLWTIPAARIAAALLGIAALVTVSSVVYTPRDFGGLVVAPPGYVPTQAVWSPFAPAVPLYEQGAVLLAVILAAARLWSFHRATATDPAS